MISIDESIYAEKKWYALQTKSRHEKQIDLRLSGFGFESFLPLRTIVSKWKDRKKKVEFPLFPGYTFVKMSMLDKRRVLETPSVVSIVGTHQPEPMRDADIEAVRTFLESEIEFDPYPYLIEGRGVQVRRGPLKGVCGVLESKRTKHRLIVNLDLINNSVSTEIDAEDVIAL